MYQKLPNLVIGFHGCSKQTFENVINKGQQLKKSMNSYDWLGHGIYFWEQNYERAREWAVNQHKDDPAVIGAVIDLGYCLNLTDSFNNEFLRLGYDMLKHRCDTLGLPLPKNKMLKGKDVLHRDLDCAVIEQIHYFNEQSDNAPFDSVRGIFIEGEPPYEGSAFCEKTHVQLCICNPNCIKGYFEPRQRDEHWNLP